MRPCRAILIVALVAGGLAIGSSRAADPAGAGSSLANTPYLIRVYYLQGTDSRDAANLLRTKLDVRNVVRLSDRGVVIASDTSDQVDRAEKALRDRGALLRATDPHGPVYIEGPARGPEATRVFHVAGDGLSQATTALRTLYPIRNLKAAPEDSTLTVHAEPSILDASEALLRELSLLAAAAGGS